MITIDQIKQEIQTVAEEYPIKKVELFGSYADGIYIAIYILTHLICNEIQTRRKIP